MGSLSFLGVPVRSDSPLPYGPSHADTFPLATMNVNDNNNARVAAAREVIICTGKKGCTEINAIAAIPIEAPPSPCGMLVPFSFLYVN